MMDGDPRPGPIDRLWRWVSLGIPLLATTLILARNIDFVPIWDGRTYCDALLAAVRAPFNPLNFNVFAHPSMLFFLWTGLGQFFDPGNAVLLNVSQLVLALVGVVSFWSIAGRLFTDKGEIERLLLTSAFAVCPVVLASEQNVNPDTGVCVFLLAYLALLFDRRFLGAVVAGLFLVSSKESGVLLYPIATGLFLLADRDGKSLGAWISGALRKTYGFAPLLFYGSVVLVSRLAGRVTVWTDPTGAGKKEGLLRLFLIPWSRPVVQNAYVGGICVLNFGWVMTGVIVAALVATLVRVLRHRPAIPAGLDHRLAFLLLALLFIAGYTLTRFPTFTNVRYLLPIFPLYILAFGVALRALTDSRGIQMAALLIVSILSCISVFRTADPVSRALYGTFPFGRHHMLAMTSITGECCGYGRDQLEYNLEYVHFGTIQDQIYRAIRPNSGTVVARNFFAHWHIDGYLDPVTFRRTLRSKDALTPQFRTTDQILTSKDPPAELFFIAYPNLDNTPDFAWLTRSYRITGVQEYSKEGYSIPVLRMIRTGQR